MRKIFPAHIQERWKAKIPHPQIHPSGEVKMVAAVNQAHSEFLSMLAKEAIDDYYRHISSWYVGTFKRSYKQLSIMCRIKRMSDGRLRKTYEVDGDVTPLAQVYEAMEWADGTDARNAVLVAAEDAADAA
jgi:hypothetical protein